MVSVGGVTYRSTAKRESRRELQTRRAQQRVVTGKEPDQSETANPFRGFKKPSSSPANSAAASSPVPSAVVSSPSSPSSPSPSIPLDQRREAARLALFSLAGVATPPSDFAFVEQMHLARRIYNPSGVSLTLAQYAALTR